MTQSTSLYNPRTVGSGKATMCIPHCPAATHLPIHKSATNSCLHTLVYIYIHSYTRVVESCLQIY